MSDLFNLIVNRSKETQFFTAIVSSLDPLQVKIYPGDSAINCKSTTGLVGLNVGSNVILIKISNQFIIINVIGDVNFNYCILGNNSSQSISNATLTGVEYSTGTTVYDPKSMHSETTNNTRITILKAGYYNITLVGRFADSSTAGRIFYLYKNGSFNSGLLSGHDGNGRYGGSFNTVLNLAVNDYLEFFVLQESGGNLNLTSSQFIVVPLIIV